MAIEYKTEIEGNLLKVITWGKDEGLEQANQYAAEITHIATEHGCTKILCDERNLIYSLSTIESYLHSINVTEMAANRAYVAIVCNPDNIEDAGFWEMVAKNRGGAFQFFDDNSEAEKWLMTRS